MGAKDTEIISSSRALLNVEREIFCELENSLFRQIQVYTKLLELESKHIPMLMEQELYKRRVK